MQKSRQRFASAFIFGGFKMTFQKYKNNGRSAQSVVEYALLTAIAIVALLATSNFVSRLKRNAFEDHFQRVSVLVGGVNP